MGQKTSNGRRAAAVALLGAIGAAACGGGGGSTTASTPAPAEAPAPAPTSTAVAVKVVDGPLRNALVCLDVDDDGACGAGEPQARTGPDGRASLDVPNALVGKHAVVAMVGTDAVDVDFGPVTSPFVLVAPKDRAGVVSPLTTLVDSHARTTGTDSAGAEAELRARVGLDASLFADYTASSDGALDRARSVARLVVLTTQQQSTALAAAVGTTDFSGAKITAADVQRATVTAIIDALPAMGAAVADSSVTAATDRDAALLAVARDLAERSSLNATSVAAAVGLQRLYAQAPAAVADAGTGAAMLRAVQQTDAANWSYRAVAQSPADLVPDAQGRFHFYDLRESSVAGTRYSWGGLTARDGTGGDMFWNGSTWGTCSRATRGTLTARDAAGRMTWVYCGGLSWGAAAVAEVPVAGRSLRSVIEQIRTLPGGDSGLSYSAWGPVDLSVLGDAVFPAGAVMRFQRNVEAGYAPQYSPTTGVHTVANAGIAAGGDTRGAVTPACASVTDATPTSVYRTGATSLETVIARNRGTPCVYASVDDGVGNGSGPRNEWWSNSTIQLGTYFPKQEIRPVGTGVYYAPARDVRIAFGDGDRITWYACLLRAANASARNCDVAGTGTYRIETLGDARVMSFSAVPTVGQPVNYERVLIERGGLVYTGYRYRTGVYDSTRLNLVAGNALLSKMGLPVMAP